MDLTLQKRPSPENAPEVQFVPAPPNVTAQVEADSPSHNLNSLGGDESLWELLDSQCAVTGCVVVVVRDHQLQLVEQLIRHLVAALLFSHLHPPSLNICTETSCFFHTFRT